MNGEGWTEAKRRIAIGLIATITKRSTAEFSTFSDDDLAVRMSEYEYVWHDNSGGWFDADISAESALAVLGSLT